MGASAPNTRAREAEGERKGAAGEEGEGVDWGQSISQKEKRCETHPVLVKTILCRGF